MVGMPSASAQRCAVTSTPIASPLTTVGLEGACAMVLTILVHHSLPYGDMSLVPTTEMFRPRLKMSPSSEQLLTYSPAGASGHSLSSAG